MNLRKKLNKRISDMNTLVFKESIADFEKFGISVFNKSGTLCLNTFAEKCFEVHMILVGDMESSLDQLIYFDGLVNDFVGVRNYQEFSSLGKRQYYKIK